jgi:hypothetical protein
VHELVVPPLVLLLAWLLVRRALGARRAAGELLALVAYGFLLEWVAMRVFASHRYALDWRAAPLGVPLAVAMVWAAVITAAMTLGGRRHPGRPLRIAARAALLGVALDLLIEPVATRLGFWTWTPEGPWLAVPLGNFVGWGVIVGTYAWGAERFPALGARLGLAVGCVAALVVVGLTWRALGIEERLGALAGWGTALTVWGVVALGYPASGTTGQRARPDSLRPGLPTRLGLAHGREPAAILLILAGVFAWDAAWLGDGSRLLVAALTVGALSRETVSSG